ncbi:MAG TPA: PspC domain-containing protein [Acidimicrobiales bacterium]|nr:PspC domain-containing protein [Acidimicrobiales bacterium]
MTSTSSTTPPPPPSYAAGLHRSVERRMIAGVAGGLAELLDVDVTLVRVAFVLLAFFGGLALPLYVAGWVLIPDAATGRSIAEDLLSRSGVA